jgi:hypothetical protein
MKTLNINTGNVASKENDENNNEEKWNGLNEFHSGTT